MTCGHNPHLWARRVEGLRWDQRSGRATWQERDLLDRLGSEESNMSDVDNTRSDDSAAGLLRALRRWGYRINLDLVLRHFVTVEELIAADDDDATNPEKRASAEVSRRLNAVNAVLLACATVEEILWLVERAGPATTISGDRRGLDRFKPALAGLGIPVGEATWWTQLKDAYVVRDCLLHSNGRLSLMKVRKRGRIEAVLAAESGLSERHDRVQVASAYVRKVVMAAQAMIDAICQAQRRE
jgi:hypothetical protein